MELLTHTKSCRTEKALESKADLVVADSLEMTTEEIQNLKMDNIILNEDHTIEKSGELLFLQDLNPHQCYVWRTLFRKGFIHHHHLTFVPGIYYQDVPFTHECYIKAEKCLRTSRLLNIYRTQREFSATNSFDLYGWRLLSACHPIVYSMPCHPSFHFSVNHGCGNNGKCSTSFS